MKQVLISAFFMAASVMAHADPSALYGNWDGDIKQPTFELKIVLGYSAGQITGTNTCIFGGQSVTVTATTTAQITDSQILVTGTAQDSKQVAGQNCSIDFEPMAFDYTINGSSLTLTQGNQSLVLTHE